MLPVSAGPTNRKAQHLVGADATSDLDPPEGSFFGVLSGPMVRRVWHYVQGAWDAPGMGSNPALGSKIHSQLYICWKPGYGYEDCN